MFALVQCKHTRTPTEFSAEIFAAHVFQQPFYMNELQLPKKKKKKKKNSRFWAEKHFVSA